MNLRASPNHQHLDAIRELLAANCPDTAMQEQAFEDIKTAIEFFRQTYPLRVTDMLARSGISASRKEIHAIDNQHRKLLQALENLSPETISILGQAGEISVGMGPGRPSIHSFAHGGMKYELTDRDVTIHLVAGDRYNYMCRIVEVLRQRGELYRRAERMVAIRHDGTFEVQTEQTMLTLLDRSFRFEALNGAKKTSSACNASLPLARQILGSFGPEFPLVNTVVTAPILVPGTHRLIDAAGFDVDSGTYAMLPDDICQPITTPTLDDVVQALGLLWSPVRLFPFVGPIDQTVMLTAMLTAVERPLLPTAPGFAFDAPVQGSGKSLLTKVLAELSGTEPVMSPHPGSQSDEEMRKTLFAKLLEGRRVIVFDNVIGDVDSASLAAVLTGKTYSDRLLQTSSSPQVPTNALVLLSGNNMTLKGDLPRRILQCRIDPKSETPHQRQFAFNPDELVRAQRQQMVAAALTLFFGYLTLGKGAQYGKGRMASFEAWDGQLVLGVTAQLLLIGDEENAAMPFLF